MANSNLSSNNVCECVVNCFQISNFVLWQTAKSQLCLWLEMLWIAFKLVILSYGKQHFGKWHHLPIVVNCFQISNFVLWQTAQRLTPPSYIGLWIAFKLVILSYGKQPIVLGIVSRSVVNCFQISNFVLWQTAKSLAVDVLLVLWIAFKLVILSYGKQLQSVIHIRRKVVNCFQISNFVLWQTAKSFAYGW